MLAKLGRTGWHGDAWPDGDSGAAAAASDAVLGRWLKYRLDDREAHANVALLCDAEPHVDSALLTAAFRLVLARHPMLRTSYLELGGQLTPQVHAPSQFTLATLDDPGLSDGPASMQLRAEASRVFDLTRALPIRAVLATAATSRRVLLVAAHPLACDAPSLRQVLAEVDEAARALSAGAAVPARETPAFEDHARWRLDHLADPAAAKEVAYWRATLHGAAPPELPRPAPARAAPDEPLGAASLALAPPLAARLARQSSDERLGLIAAAVAALLYRYTGARDVVLGAETSARRAGFDERVVGCFATTLALRFGLDEASTGQALRDQADAALAAAQACHYGSLRHVILALDPDQRLPSAAVLPVRVEVHGAAESPPWGLSEPRPLRQDLPCVLLFGLALDDAPRLTCDFRTDHYPAAVVGDLLQILVRLLDALASQPGERVAALPILDDAERARLLDALNPVPTPYPPVTAASLIDAQARRTPGATALVCGEETLTYAELEAATNCLARAFRDRGIGRGDRIGLCLDRSPALILSLLAAMKAGASYVPLDPAYPAERLAYMIDTSAAALVVTRRGLPNGVETAGAAVLGLDELDWRAGDPSPIPAEVGLDDPAYVIHTSGSTGRPKGVEITHRGLTNFLWTMRERPGIGADDTLLAVTTISFDVAVLELLLPLAVGARIVLARDAEVSDGLALRELIDRHGVTVMQTTPSRWQLLLDAGWNGRPGFKILTGGEALTRRLADDLLARGTVWNLYGPTETTVWSTVSPVVPGREDVPIGTAIANTRLYVLDPLGALAPRGAVGELFIGGDGVARGYVGRPELTAERFFPDPFRPGVSGGRLYRTGDLVRWREDGSLEYRGRADHQIKLRGVRIEPGEIESVLRSHPAVTQALAMVRPGWAGAEILVAYVAPGATSPGARDREELIAQLEALLRARLPRAMVPQTIMVVPALPLMPNGKVDRAALPPPPKPEQHDQSDLPASETERRLARIWRDVLDLADPRVGHDFFEAGGSSLSVARLLARVQAEFNRRLSPATLHEVATLGALARHLDEAGGETTGDSESAMQIVHLQREGAAPPLFGLHNTTVFYQLAMLLGRRQPFVAVEMRKRLTLDPAGLQELAAIASAYVQAIRSIRRSGPYNVLGWCAGGVIAYEVAQQLTALGEEVSLLVLVDADAPGTRRPAWQSFLGRVFHLAQRAASGSWPVPRPGGGGAWRATPDGKLVQALDLVDRQLIRKLDAAIMRYEPRPYAGRVLLFQRADRPKGRLIDATAGWGRLVTGDLQRRSVTGNHVDLFRDANAAFLAEQIARTLSPP